MAASAGSGLGMGTLAAGVAVAAVVGVVGYQVIFAPGPDPVVEDVPQDVASDEVAAAETTGDPEDSVTETVEAPSAADPAPPEVTPDLIAPRFDLVRVDAAGGALIAGQAESNAELRLRLDGEEIHLASSDAGGEFVAMFDIPPSELPRVLSLEMLMEDGSVLVSEQSVIISPTLRPTTPAEGTEVAEAEATGPEVPSDSGVTELAMASEPDAPPSTATAPIAPVAPDLPEGGGVAAAEEQSGGVDAQASVLETDSPDELPTVSSEAEAIADENTEDGADGAVTELASVELSEESGEGLSRGLQSDGVDPVGNAEAPADAVDPSEGPNPPLPAEVVEITEPPSETASEAEEPASEAPISDGPAPAPDAQTEADTPIAIAEEDSSPEDTTDTQITEVAPTDETLPDTGGDEVTETVEVAVEDSVTELAMVDDGSEASAEVAVETPTSSDDSPTDPSTPQADATPGVDTTAPAELADQGSSDAESTTDSPTLEPQTPTVLLADSQGIRVIQSGDEAPQVQSQVTLDTIAYDTGGDVVLAGRGPAESDVRFYLNNQPIHLAPIDLQGGWRTALPQVDPGTYTLRLDEVSSDGSVQSRIETPFLREEPEAVAAITSSSGENVITVQWGHTLWGIAQQHLGEGVMYVQIYEANRDQIRNPDLIYPGQIFTIPGLDE